MNWPSKQGADERQGASDPCRRGLEHLKADRTALALEALQAALRESPDNHEVSNGLGNVHKAMGNIEQALDCYKRALQIAPEHLPSLYNLGLALRDLDRLDESEQYFRRAHRIAPADTEVLSNIGAVLCRKSNFAEGAEMFRDALRLAPGDFRLWLLLGSACRQIARGLEEAVRCLRRCIELEPECVDGYFELGMAYRAGGDAQRAAEAFGRALELQPELPDALIEMGGILTEQGKPEEAAGCYEAAIRLRPESVPIYNLLGCVYSRMGRLDEAVDCLRTAIALQPDYADAHHNLGNAWRMHGARGEALQCFEEAYRLRPGDPVIQEAMLCEKQELCDWRGLEELVASRRRNLAGRDARAVNPFGMLSIPSARAEQLRCARAYSAELVRPIARDNPQFSFDRGARDRLRIGYLSANFHKHAIAYLVAELFELHNRDRFEIRAYSYGPDDGSPMRARLKCAFDSFTEVSALSHAEAARAIHADGTDILVDLTGHTENARLEIAALRPAPVQVHLIGYPGTLGADFIDYLIADRFVVPAEHAGDYHERLVRLPGSYLINDRQRPIAATPQRVELGLPEDGFVFCCFNHAYKIMPTVFSAWMRILRGTPGSVLWLFESNQWAMRNLRRMSAEHGVEPSRLIFAPTLPHAEHLGRLRAADIFLDTFPYNAHTTARDALWAGLPLLTCAGDTFASRVAGSLLTAVGLPELITTTLEEYEALGLGLARSPDRLLDLRGRLARNRETAPLFDTPTYVRNLESAYEAMWRNYISGSGPSAIEL